MFEKVQKIPSREELLERAPLPENLRRVKRERDGDVRRAVLGESDKFLVIIGPCSADDEDSVADYVSRLLPLQEKTRDKLIIIPRIYTNKPRTTGEGYKGMLHQPNPESEPNILDGILAIRRMHVRILGETGLSAADEMLYPDNLDYVEDLLSYIAIGARSVENQQHRLVSSGAEAPVGMKNPMSGDLTVMMNSIAAAQSGHNFIYQSHEVKTAGNPLAHAVMRGSVNSHGEHLQNYHYENLTRAAELYAERGLKNPMVVVDTNHSNSKKAFAEQPRICKEILNSRKYNADLRKIVRGLMIESYIEEGAQAVGGGVYGKSITDACLGWNDTVALILNIAESV